MGKIGVESFSSASPSGLSKVDGCLSIKSFYGDSSAIAVNIAKLRELLGRKD
jgi:hypothetical protein